MNDIGWAVGQLRQGRKVRRAAWERELILRLSRELNGVPCDLVLLLTYSLGEEVWQADQEDLLATDWEVAS